MTVASTLVVQTNPCQAWWGRCPDGYTTHHYCVRDDRHPGRHRCPCGATSTHGRDEASTGGSGG